MIRLNQIWLYLFVLELHAQGQSFKYSDRELYTTGARLPLIAAPGEQFHLWSFERSQVKLHTFDRDLQFRETKVIKTPIKPGFKFEFLQFHSFYYTVMSDSSSAKIFRIDKECLMTDQTELVLGKLFAKEVRPYFFTNGRSHIFLVQKLNDDPAKNTVVNITKFDSVFNYQHKIAIIVPYLYDQPQNIQFTQAGEQLLLLSAKMSRGEIAICISKVDAVTGVLTTKDIPTGNLNFLRQKIFEADGGFILESLVWKFKNGMPGDQFTYFIKLTNDLEQTHSLFLNADESSEFNTAGYVFFPKLTRSLTGKRLLTISMGRKKDGSIIGSNEIYRFITIDSNFQISNSVMQPSERGKFSPTLSLRNDNGLHFYYEEEIRFRVSIIHRYQLKGTTVEEEPLLLKANLQYDLNKAVMAGVSSFVMPYYRKFNIGLVRVKM